MGSLFYDGSDGLDRPTLERIAEEVQTEFPLMRITVRPHEKGYRVDLAFAGLRFDSKAEIASSAGAFAAYIIKAAFAPIKLIYDKETP